MASASITLRKSLLTHLALFSSKRFSKYFFSTHHDSLLPLELDNLDQFTTKLMQRKSEKWHIKRTKNIKDDHVICKVQPKFIIDLEDVDRILRDAIEVNDALCITNMIKECIDVKKIPSLTNLISIYTFYSRIGDKDMIVKLMELSKLLDEDVLQQYSYFKHYLAETIWRKGNIPEAIALFEEVYSSNVDLRGSIRNMLQYLMVHSISNRSEAVLVNIIQFVHRLGKNYNDFYPLACIWKHCILSEWFTDQCIALDLLENNEDLRKNVIDNLSSIIVLALKNHQIDIVYRILEVLMKFEEKAHYGEIVEALFNYRANQGDLHGCTEIVQWCRVQNITLPVFHQEQFVNLLLRHTSKSKENVGAHARTKLTEVPTYCFKF